MRILTLSIAVLFSACSHAWVHPTKGEREFKQDLTKCRSMVGLAQGFLSDCLEGEGWTEK